MVMSVYVLSGVTHRDADEIVCQFFPHTAKGYQQLEEFRESLPGRYDVLVVSGIDYDAIEVQAIVY
jgi:hypothetical protein